MSDPVRVGDTDRFREVLRRRGLSLVPTEVPEGETAEDRAERLRLQQAGRDRAWADSAGTLAAATLEQLHDHQDRDATSGKTRAVSGWLGSGARALVLHGPSGHGKTHAAYAVGNAAVAAGLWTVAYRLVRLNSDLRHDRTRDRARYLLDTVPLLVLDDLGAENTTDWTAEQLQDVLDERLTRAHHRTIITTNLSGQQVVDRYGDRIASRLTQDARLVKIEGRLLRAPAPW